MNKWRNQPKPKKTNGLDWIRSPSMNGKDHFGYRKEKGNKTKRGTHRPCRATPLLPRAAALPESAVHRLNLGGSVNLLALLLPGRDILLVLREDRLGRAEREEARFRRFRRRADTCTP